MVGEIPCIRLQKEKEPEISQLCIVFTAPASAPLFTWAERIIPLYASQPTGATSAIITRILGFMIAELPSWILRFFVAAIVAVSHLNRNVGHTTITKTA